MHTYKTSSKRCKCLRISNTCTPNYAMILVTQKTFSVQQNSSQDATRLAIFNFRTFLIPIYNASFRGKQCMLCQRINTQAQPQLGTSGLMKQHSRVSSQELQHEHIGKLLISGTSPEKKNWPATIHGIGQSKYAISFAVRRH